MNKTEQAVRNHPRVEQVDDERGYDCGIWAYMKPGWIREPNDYVHNVHEDSWTAVLKGLRNAVPCDCSECRKRLS